MSSPNSYQPPGRLGDPEMNVATDPRTNPEVLKTLIGLGIDKASPSPATDMTIEAQRPIMEAANNAFSGMYAYLENELPDDVNEPRIDQSEVTIKGDDGHDIKLHIFRPADLKGDLPCVVYTHGGGMTILDTVNEVHNRWCKSLAVSGVAVIMVDFRNAFTSEGHNPFPIGLNDCAAAAKYIVEHKSEFKIGRVVLQGESGGANLAIATTLVAKRDGWVGSIDGVYGLVPYISGGYGWPKERKLKELPSLIENEGYLLDTNMLAGMAYYYSPDKFTDSYAWPYHASEEQLEGLPPFILSMDELDPLRDEGMAFVRKLLAAGVKTVGRVNMGITHGTALAFRKAVPDIHNAIVREIAGFAKAG